MMYRFFTWFQQQVIYYKFYIGLNSLEISKQIGTTRQNIDQVMNTIKDKFKNTMLYDFGSKDRVKLMDIKENKNE